MKFISRISILLVLGLVSVNCGGASHDSAQGNEDGELEAPLSFALVKNNVFSKYGCINCHGPNKKSAHVDLSTYESIMNHPGLVILNADPNDSILIKVIASGDMPPRGATVSPADLDLLKEWISAGAPN